MFGSRQVGVEHLNIDSRYYKMYSLEPLCEALESDRKSV